MSSFEEVMRAAIALALGTRPHPNPRVGAVVLDRGGRAVGRGSHHGPGHPHAEVEALVAAGPAAAGGTLVVTLEPCQHHGRTPPCTRTIIEAGITRVVVGATDPDPRMRGAGITALLEAGIDVVEDVLTPEVEALDPAYFHHRRSGRPRFTLKAALTLDGQIAAADGSSQWISGVEAREDAHRLRAEADAVMVGAGSVRADDPRLTVRLPGHEGPQPRPVVVVGRGALSPEAAVWGTDAVVVATRPTGLPAQEILVGEREGWPDLGEAALRLAELGLIDILVEGGQGLAASLLAQGLIDRGVFYLAAKLAGGAGKGPFSGSWTTLRAAREIEIVTVRRLGDDLRVEWVMDVHRNH